MHPEILRELTAQRHRDLQERAHRVQLARTARRTLRAMRHGTHPDDEFVTPAIPDYVDGSFRAEPAASEPAGSEAGRAPAAHRAV